MISYELAKDLKVAGFPFKNWDEIEELGVMPRTTNSILSELIRDCGDAFELVQRRMNPDRTTKEWIAYGAYDSKMAFHGTVIYADKNGVGETPEIAVAKLWLALNGDKSKK